MSGPVSVLHFAILLTVVTIICNVHKLLTKNFTYEVTESFQFGFPEWTYQQRGIPHTGHVKGMQKRSVHIRNPPHNWGKRKKSRNSFKIVHLSGTKGVNGSYHLHHSRIKQFQHTLRHKDIRINTTDMAAMVFNASEASARPKNFTGTKLPQSQKHIKESSTLHPITKQSNILHLMTKEFITRHPEIKEYITGHPLIKEYITRQPDIKDYVSKHPEIKEYVTEDTSNIKPEDITTLPPIPYKKKMIGRRLIVTASVTETSETPILSTEKSTTELMEEEKENNLDGFKDLIPISLSISTNTPNVITDGSDSGSKENVITTETGEMTSTQRYESTSTIRYETVWEWVMRTTHSTPTVTPEASDSGSDSQSGEVTEKGSQSESSSVENTTKVGKGTERKKKLMKMKVKKSSRRQMSITHKPKLQRLTSTTSGSATSEEK